MFSSAAMMDGESTLGVRYARAQRQSPGELQQQSMAKAQAIFDAQVCFLCYMAGQTDEQTDRTDLDAYQCLFPLLHDRTDRTGRQDRS